MDTTMTRMARGRLVILLAAVLLALTEVRAAPLDAESCTNLKGELTQLEGAGVQQNIAKGPQWAKANLAPDKLQQIRRLIEVEEQLMFRCMGGRSLVELPQEPDPDPAAAAEKGEDAKEGAPAAPAGAQKKATGAADKKSKDAVKKAPAGKPPGAPAKAGDAAKQSAPAAVKGPSPAKQAREGGPQAPAAKAATPKPKAKADDAYKAAPPDPAVNPFAKQQAPAAKQ